MAGEFGKHSYISARRFEVNAERFLAELLLAAMQACKVRWDDVLALGHRYGRFISTARCSDS
jgi:hypothetical protein